MKINKSKLIILIFSICILGSTTNAYLFGIKSFDNTIDNIQKIEQKYNFDFPVIAFIFDPRSSKVANTLNNLNKQFGEDKIYHISISPDKYSALEVSQGKFDNKYIEFFELVKKNNLKVIFRTMHEMNGGRYPRSSDPDNFKKARIHIRELSRALGLNQHNILFDMSINHWDMPSKYKPSQQAILTKCSPKNKYSTIVHKKAIGTGYKTKTVETKIPKNQTKREKISNKPIAYDTIGQTIQIPYTIYDIKTEKKQNCFSFEDYYPGDKYIDIMGVTFYNRGKASYNRHWYNSDRILNDTNRNTLDRLKSFNKPIFIDEVATTAVYYDGSYKQNTSQEIYQNNQELKNKRLVSLKDFMLQNPEILGMIYFNIDYTYGLTQRLVGEADRAIINLNNDRYYTGTDTLYQNQNLDNKLYDLFQTNSTTSIDKTNELEEIGKYAQIIAKTLKNKFGIEESIYKLNKILKIIKKQKIKKIIEQTIKLLNK